ncbi:hypothetical protein KY285_007843 [Solanum tuberosum]|nr:hypothetical protein KY285_007843 [Solanum tuberosum]
MEPVGPYGRNRLIFKVKRSPEWTSVLLKNFVDVHQDLRYGAGWSRWSNRPIFKVKLSTERVNHHFTDFLEL